MARKSLRARTMVELLAVVYATHGWRRVEGESRARRVKLWYDIRIEGDYFVARPK